MSLALTASFAENPNLVLPLASSSTKGGLAIRVASTGSATLGTLTASGQAATPVTWSISGNPSWVTLSVDSTTLIATISFSNAQAQANPYQFFITASDGARTVTYPIFLEVRDPLSIVSSSGATAFSIPSYDSSVADLVFYGVGLNGAHDTGVSFIAPTTLPPGMSFITSDGGSMALRVAESSSSSVSGGISLFTTSPVSMGVTLRAYKPGTMYDNPDRCFRQNITIDSLTAKPGTVDLSLTAMYNTLLNAFTLNAWNDFLQGQTVPILYEWDVTGTATGNITAGGSSSDATMTWVPSSAGYVIFTLKVKNASTGVVLAQTTTPRTPCTNVSTWTSTPAVKLSFSGVEVRSYANGTASLVVSTPVAEFNSSETITVTLTAVPGSVIEATATFAATTVVLTAANPSATVSLNLPESGFNQKWTIMAAAANAPSSPTRTGFAQVAAISNGDPLLTVTVTGGDAITSNVGVAMAPITLAATNAVPVSVPSAVFSLSGAPSGLYIDGSDRLAGNVLAAGTYNFSVVASASGYARAYHPVSLVASAFFSKLTISDAIPALASVPDNQQFNVSWGYAGTPLTLNLLQGLNLRSVLGTTSASLTEVGSSVITIYGSSFYGDAYSIPAMVLSSSVASLGNLPDAPTVGIIDEAFNLALQWNPPTINGAYLAYRAWNIYLQLLPSGLNTLQTVNGALPTGLEPSGATSQSRLFQKTVTAGDYQVSMQALTSDTTIAANAVGWDSAHEFPAVLTGSLVTFDRNTISLGQTLTISLDPSYTGADTWQATYPDGTTSGWLPISIRTLAKTFQIAGALSIIIQTQRDYSTDSPAVKLMRQIVKPIYIMNQQYVIAGQASNTITGNLGIGGESGFEVTDASTGAVPLEPYEVVVRALVRDTLSHEMKLLVATARTNDASSQLGTMALDVFPIQGRPRTVDLVDPGLYLSSSMSTAGNPVKVQTKTLPNIIVGKPMADFPLAVAVNSGVAPFSWYADNLPFGLKLSVNGILSGTALAVGTTSCNFAVVDSNTPRFIAHASLAITVQSDLAITTTAVPQAIVGTPYSFAITSSGGIPPATFSIVAGSLPQGLSINSTTGVITGTPVTYNSTTDFFKSFTFTVEAVDAIGSLASVSLSMTLAPAALHIANPDQAIVYADDSFEITLPVFGGTAPYALSSFTDDGTIGTGLQITTSAEIAVLAGVTPPALSIVTGDQTIYPQYLNTEPAIQLAATGGVGPYTFTVVSSTNGSVIYSGLLIANYPANGTFATKVMVTDSLGQTATKIINVTMAQKNSGVYSITPIQVNLNSSTNPANWTITQIAALPDAKNGLPYNAGSGTYYGLALLMSGALHMTQSSGSIPMNFELRSGSLPGGIVAFSANSFGNSTDYSGIVLFNVSGGSNPTVNGNFSFEAEFSNIVSASGALVQTVARESISVTASGVGATKVVVVTSTGSLAIDLSRTNPAAKTAYGVPWVFPLIAEGATGPYSFNILSGTTLPGATVVNPSNPMLGSTTTTVGSYTAIVTATSADGVTSAPVSLSITIGNTPSQAIHIMDVNLPGYLYANRPIPSNTYYVDSDVQGLFSATGLPAGVTLSATAGTRSYLQGTPTSSGNFTATVVATSVVSNLTTSISISLSVRPQSAVFINPPTTALVGQKYRAITNNAIIQVQYTGYLPTDGSLPLVTALHGTVGAPGVLSNGTATTSVSSLTSDGFILSFDYVNATYGAELLTLGSNLATEALQLIYPALVATGSTFAATVSEYSLQASFAAPITITGGLAPYTVTYTAFSNPNFSSLSGQVGVNVTGLVPGQTTGCSVGMHVTDSIGNLASATGVLQITVRQETYISVRFIPGAWMVNLSGGVPLLTTYTPNSSMSTPVLGHAPYQYYVDNVTLPNALQGFVKISPTNRVLAINCNNTAASQTVPDVDPTLAASSNFVVSAVPSASAPTLGSYQIQVTLRVVDETGLSSTMIETITVVLS